MRPTHKLVESLEEYAQAALGQLSNVEVFGRRMPVEAARECWTSAISSIAAQELCRFFVQSLPVLEKLKSKIPSISRVSWVRIGNPLECLRKTKSNEPR